MPRESEGFNRFLVQLIVSNQCDEQRHLILVFFAIDVVLGHQMRRHRLQFPL